MPDQDKITGYIQYARRVIDAIKQGKITADELDGMTDEQIDLFIARQQSVAQAEIDRGKRLDEPGT